MKKILFVTNTIQTMSGASKIFRFVAKGMVEQGYETEALVLFDGTIENTIEGVKIHCLGCKHTPKLVWRCSVIRKMREIIKCICPDIVCTFVEDACFMTRAATLGMPVKVISCERGDPSWGGPLWHRVTRWTYGNSDACVFQLPEVKDYFGEKNLKKAYVIPNPFIPLVQPDRSVRNSTIVSAGRFTEQKGYDVLIRAFGFVREKHPEYKLIIWGDGDLRDSYQTIIDELHLNDSVELPGFTSNVSEAIKNEGIFVLSSRFEGIPNTLIEAMSMGLPCVATDCSPGGAKFLAADESRALIVPQDDIRLLADAVCRVIENPDLAERLSQNALQVRTAFDPKRIIWQWGEVFRSIGD